MAGKRIFNFSSGFGAPSRPGNVNPVVGDFYVQLDAAGSRGALWRCAVGGSSPTWKPLPLEAPFYALVSGSSQAFDASAWYGLHYDIQHDCALTATNVTEGQLVRAALDGDPSNDYTVTFGTGFSSTGTLALTHATTAVLLFVGHDGKLMEIARTTGLT